LQGYPNSKVVPQGLISQRNLFKGVSDPEEILFRVVTDFMEIYVVGLIPRRN
jgi:hypothetical protein